MYNVSLKNEGKDTENSSFSVLTHPSYLVHCAKFSYLNLFLGLENWAHLQLATSDHHHLFSWHWIIGWFWSAYFRFYGIYWNFYSAFPYQKSTRVAAKNYYQDLFPVWIAYKRACSLWEHLLFHFISWERYWGYLSFQ